MRSLLPGTVAGWMIATVLAGLVASQLLSLAIHDRERDAMTAVLESFRVGERISGVVELVQRAAPALRAQTAEQLNAPTLRVEWGDSSTVPADSRGWRTELLKAAVDRGLEDGSWREIRVAEVAAGGDPQAPSAPEHRTGSPAHHESARLDAIAHGIAGGPSFALAVQLRDGSWLNFAVPLVGSTSLWSAELVVGLAVSVVVVLALSLVAIRRVTAPLRALARAAEQFGTDINAPEPRPHGSRELRQTIESFNEMRRRIRRFVEDRTQMMAAISHDLRTPITRLRLRAEFVDEGEQQRKMLADLDEMETMIGEVLSFAREEVVVEARQPIDLAALVADVCADMLLQGARVSMASGAAMPMSGRPSALRRCIGNLIGNAVRHGGSAAVEVRQIAGGVIVTVDDNGAGIPPGEQERVFRPFYRLESSRSRDTGGAGLGLAVARTVARGHGGDVRLENRSGGGLRVTLVLPVGTARGEAGSGPRGSVDAPEEAVAG